LYGLLQSANAWADGLLAAVQTSNGRPLPGAVILVHPLAGNSQPGAAVNAVMDQVNRTFVPDILVIPVGSTVAFPNSDSVSHQIYSFSPARRFQLPLYRGKPYPPVVFDQAGIVTLGCNIHDSMLAYVLVTDAPYFGRTDATGSWSVDLPPGAYRVTVWQPRMQESPEQEVSVSQSGRTVIHVRLTKALRPAPLESRHSWDTY
jgi:plastocyanin